MKIISYNVNGVRAAIKKGLLDWLKAESPDVFCIQESKAQEDQVDPALFEDLGYTGYWHSAEKKGYSGVVTYSKIKPSSVIKGIGIEKYDREGRVIRTDINNVSVLNCYFPSGSSGEERHQFKMDFLQDLKPHVDGLITENRNLVILGDYNVVRLDIDIHNPKRKDKPSGFRPEERKWLNDWFDADFIDAYRKFEPETPDVYSWWTYRLGAKSRNKGWRIDYISCSNQLDTKIRSAKHHVEVNFSDHCPIEVQLQL